jgi:hypothetical protein
MALSNYGEAFATNVLRKYYSNALTPTITNSDYEGEIKKIGDRVNILMFLEDIALSDYTVGSDMGTQHPADTEAQLTISQKKYYNFDIDAVDKQFTYVEDMDSALIDNAAKALEKEIDRFVLYKMADNIKAGNYVGVNLLFIGDGADTNASISTSATGGSIVIDVGSVNGDAAIESTNIAGNGVLDTLFYGGFTAADIGKPVRLVSSTGYSTSWYRITAASNSITATVENWDSSVAVTSSGLVAAGDILYGIHGDGLQNADVNDFINGVGGVGLELQAAAPTTISSSNVYGAIVALKQVLDDNDIPYTDRFIVIPPAMQTALLSASELQPDIAMYHDQTIVNGKVGRVAGFEVVVATGAKLSTRAAHSTATGQGGDCVVSAGTTSYNIIAGHKSFCTFAHKWSDSRVVESQLQFAKLYQGLNLYGAQVLNLRRKAGACLFCTF